MDEMIVYKSVENFPPSEINTIKVFSNDTSSDAFESNACLCTKHFAHILLWCNISTYVDISTGVFGSLYPIMPLE